MAESYADEQRRRNGLPPLAGRPLAGQPPGEHPLTLEQIAVLLGADLLPDTVVTAELVNQLSAEQPPNTVHFTFAIDATAAERALDRLAGAFDLRCPHTDLLPAMCHHCKEKPSA